MKNTMEHQIRIKACGTCGRTLEIDPPETGISSYPALQSMVQRQLSQSTIYIGTKPVAVNFMHLIADVECLECHDTAKVEVRL